MQSSSAIRVLIAEDDYLLAQEIERTLRKIGYTCAGIASNGEMAVELTATLKPDIVLMDIKMPRMDGLEASRKIQESCPTPVVALTAHESQDLVEEASRSGIGAYINKPPMPEMIERAVTIAMARHKDLMKSYQLIRELEEKETALRESLHTKDRFFSILAHDLRNPVSALMNFSDQLIRHADQHSKEELVDNLKIILDSSKDLFDLLENLLLWSRIQNKTLRPVPELIDLSDIAQHAIRSEGLHAVNKSISLQYHGADSISAYADKAMVETVFRNLLTNAVKFTPKGGSVHLTVVQVDDLIEVNVEDNGVGIPESIISQLLNEGSVGSSAGTTGERGSGLGLPLCSELVENNGGHLRISSHQGKGTQVSFTLPGKKETKSGTSA